MGDNNETVTAKVFRFDPATDEQPYYDTFEVPYDDEETVMGVLKYIATHQDPSLAFRESCRIGNCLICLLRVNGKKVLACRETLKAIGDGELVLEPADRENVIRDLVCDM